MKSLENELHRTVCLPAAHEQDDYQQRYDSQQSDSESNTDTCVTSTTLFSYKESLTVMLGLITWAFLIPWDDVKDGIDIEVPWSEYREYALTKIEKQD